MRIYQEQGLKMSDKGMGRTGMIRMCRQQCVCKRLTLGYFEELGADIAQMNRGK
jgi:hypothetical protein